MTGSCPWGSARSVSSVGRFGIESRCMAGSVWGSSAILGRKFIWWSCMISARLLTMYNAPFRCFFFINLNCTLFFGMASCGLMIVGQIAEHFLPVDGPELGEALGVNVLSSVFSCLLLLSKVAPVRTVTVYLLGTGPTWVALGCDKQDLLGLHSV